MKKSIIALAVAGALTAPMVAQADATLYGSLRIKVEAFDKHDFNVKDNSSRIGIKGSVDTGISGVKAIYRGEWKVNTADGATFGSGRLAYVGLTGGFGTAAIGQQWTPYYTFVTGATDILDGNSTAPTQQVFRKGNMLAYISPDMGGFQVAGGIISDDDHLDVPARFAEGHNGDDVDLYNIAAKFNMAGFGVGVSYLANEMIDDTAFTAVSLSYKGGPLYAALLYQDKEIAGADAKQWELAGSYAFGSTKLLANYSDLDNDGNIFGVEVQQKLGKQARVFANYMVANDEAETMGFADGLSAGMRVDF